MSEIKLIVRPFAIGTEKEAALKPLEEASEVRAAWQKIDECGIPEQCRDCDLHNTCEAIFALADEIADTIQASCNLAARYNLDLQAAMRRCEQRNRSRGRYPMEEKHVESCGIRDGHDCDCGGDCADAPVGMGVLREKSPEEMSATELFGMLKATNSFDCRKILCNDWCDSCDNCETCRNRLLVLLKAAYKREVEEVIELIKDGRDEYMRLRTENGIMLDELIIRQDKIDKLNQQVSDLIHERDGLRNRLAELSEAGITSLHRLLRETVGEAKNVTDNARVYIDKQQGSKDERCGDCGSIGRNHGGDCGAQCAREHLLPAEPPAQEMSERERVLERLRGYDVYMAETPSENASRLFACITGNKDAEIACGNDIEAVRDKLIELLGTPGWDYCETCELVGGVNDA